MGLTTPQPGELDGRLSEPASWQHDGADVRLHPGDLGWHCRFGRAVPARALRVCAIDGSVVAFSWIRRR